MLTKYESMSISSPSRNFQN